MHDSIRTCVCDDVRAIGTILCCSSKIREVGGGECGLESLSTGCDDCGSALINNIRSWFGKESANSQCQ